MDKTSVEEGIARGGEVNVLARMAEDTREGVPRFVESRREGS